MVKVGVLLERLRLEDNGLHLARSENGALLAEEHILAGIDDEICLISPHVLEPIQDLKTNNFGNHNPRLHIDETLIALAMSATTDPIAKKAFKKLSELKNLEAHSSVILSQTDNSTFKKLGINLTCEPRM